LDRKHKIATSLIKSRFSIGCLNSMNNSIGNTTPYIIIAYKAKTIIYFIELVG